ncbi:MAG: SGNH/GDSL hydrolase family protein [Acidobacteriota bacterium]
MKKREYLAFLVSFFCLTSWLSAQAPLVGIGDSIGEGVQSADASFRTQPFTYLTRVASKMGVRLPLPLIRSGPLGVVGETNRRSRLQPSLEALNLSVSGADANSLLNDRADALSEEEIRSETDLVLFPRVGSQMEIAEALRPLTLLCWIGNNDTLSAATDWTDLDASQMTSVADFAAQFTEIADRLGALQTRVVLANIPDVTAIGFLFDRQDLIHFLGSDFGLAEGSYTTLPTMLILSLGFGDRLIQNPDFVLDPSEVSQIRERTEIFNQIIQEEASRIGSAVVDIHTIFNDMVADPPTLFGVTISRRFLGGVFSLDGVHPSNLMHALVANAFIQALNNRFQLAVPRLTTAELVRVFFEDPFIDKDGDGRVRGRFGAGLLETLAPLLGFSGDPDEFTFQQQAHPSPKTRADRLFRAYRKLGGESVLSPEPTQAEVIALFQDIFSLH